VDATAEPSRTVAAPAATASRPRGPASRSASTRRAYAADLDKFSTWCRSAGRVSLPASAETLALYATDCAQTLSRSAVDRRFAAIAAAHAERGFFAGGPDPGGQAAGRPGAGGPAASGPDPRRPLARAPADRGPGSAGPASGWPAHRALLRAAKRAASRKPRHVRLRPEQLAALARHCGRDLAGVRDRALLLLAGATWLDRKALLAIDAEDIAFSASVAPVGEAAPIRAVAPGGAGAAAGAAAPAVGGCTVVVRDPRYPGMASRFTLTRTPPPAPCAVQALEDWLRVSDTIVGPVFRAVTRGGNVQFGRLSEEAFRLIVQRRQSADRPRRPTKAPTEPLAAAGMQGPGTKNFGVTRGPREELLREAPPDLTPPSRQRAPADAPSTPPDGP
jgi:integrase